MNYSKGISWFDDCRIPFVDEKDPSAERYKYERNVDKMFDSSVGFKKTTNTENYKEQQGRFPANLLVSDDMLNDGSISQGQKNPRIQKSSRRYGENNFTNGGLFTPEGQITPTYNDKGSNSRYYDIDKWFDNILNEL